MRQGEVASVTNPLADGKTTWHLLHMKLGSLKNSKKLDGELVVVSRDNRSAVHAWEVVPSLREALEQWAEVEPQLQQIYADLNAGNRKDAFLVDENDFHSPLPRTFSWSDGSAYIQHVKLVRRARNAPLPETLTTVPLMYQGGGDAFLAPTEDIEQIDFKYGTDFEGEVGVITDFIPMQTSASEALKHIKLLVLINDVTLRGLIPDELANGFGFYQSKPASSFAPFAITPDELGEAWQNGRVHLPLLVDYNGKFFGKANAGEMHFHFGDLLAHATKTRSLCAGAIMGSGTVSSEDESVGSSCLVEQRMIEKIKTGEFKTPFMSEDETVEIKMLDHRGNNLFGTIYQRVVARRK